MKRTKIIVPQKRRISLIFLFILCGMLAMTMISCSKGGGESKGDDVSLEGRWFWKDGGNLSNVYLDFHNNSVSYGFTAAGQDGTVYEFDYSVDGADLILTTKEGGKKYHYTLKKNGTSIIIVSDEGDEFVKK